MGVYVRKQLDAVRRELMDMFALVEEQLGQAIKALVERDVRAAERARSLDREVNRLEVSIDASCLRILAREHPLASDLRFVIGCSRIAIDLERIGDQASGIAKRANFMAQKEPLPFDHMVRAMAECTSAMYRDTVNAFLNRRSEEAIEVCHRDSQVDLLYARLMKQLIEFLGCEPNLVERPLHMMFTAKSLERIADICTNISEVIVFMLQGVDIRHADQFDIPKPEGAPHSG